MPRTHAFIPFCTRDLLFFATIARMGKIIRQFLRFSAVGITAFVIDYGLLALLTEVFGINYLVSATIAFIVATVFNYLASMKYVFTHKEGMKRTREFVIFTVISIIGLLMTNGGMILGVEVIHGHYLIVKIVVAAIVSIYSFIARKYFLDAKEPKFEEFDTTYVDEGIAPVSEEAAPQSPEQEGLPIS